MFLSVGLVVLQQRQAKQLTVCSLCVGEGGREPPLGAGEAHAVKGKVHVNELSVLEEKKWEHLVKRLNVLMPSL